MSISNKVLVNFYLPEGHSQDGVKVDFTPLNFKVNDKHVVRFLIKYYISIS